MELSTVLKSFDELSLQDLYDILALRQAVFIVEQKCNYQDADGKDQLALHLMLRTSGNELAGYCRLFDKDVYFENHTAIGRVIITEKFRQKGTGYFLMENAIATVRKLFGDFPIKIGAQKHLNGFYGNCGFKEIGYDYLEDGIPHCYMVAAKSPN